MFALRVVKDPDPQWNLEDQLRQLDTAFPIHFRTRSRLDLFLEQDVFAKFMKTLESTLRDARTVLNTMRLDLIAALSEAEKNLPLGALDETAWEYEKLLHKTMKDKISSLKTRTWPEVLNWSALKLKTHSKK
jgi:hypothetical protein